MVYEVIQDNNGFLWVATDNGIARFDGKRFINYSTKDGLPSNDVIHVFKQNDGTIWVNCYKQAPSYFDEKRNKFINLDYDKHVVKLSNSMFNVYYSIRKNDLFFQNHLGNFTFSEGKIIDKLIISEKERTQYISHLYLNDEFVTIQHKKQIVGNKSNVAVKLVQNSKTLGTVLFGDYKKLYLQHNTNGKLYRFSEGSVTKIKINNLHPLQYQIQQVDVPEKIKWFKFSASKLSVISNTGNIYIYDEKSLRINSVIKTDFNVNTAYIDSKNNVWVTTVNNGLIYYSSEPIKKETYSKNAITNFLCVKVSEDGQIFAGNYQGEIYEKKGKTETKYNFAENKDNNVWIRNIHFLSGKTFVVSDLALQINFQRKIRFYNELGNLLSLKSSTKLNENELILGTTSGLLKFNIQTERYEILNFSAERILDVQRINDGSFYFSADDGLYHYNINDHQHQLIVPNRLFKNDKIQHFKPGKGSEIWISTFKGNLFLVDNHKILKEYIDDKRFPNNISNLLDIEEQLWMASKSGVYILDYKNLDKCSVSKLTTSDGLTSNVINFLHFKKDTVYAATDNGISKIPVRNIRSHQKIKPYLISVKINEKSVVLDSIYHLKSDENNISLELAGVDITGHFKNFQFALNDDQFSEIEGNFLNLQLNNGINKIQIRTVDQNNYVNNQILKITFDIETPFYKAIWFWIILSFLTSSVLFYVINHDRSIRRKRKFHHEKDLQNQREKITADLHDDVGASLSSLQINSAVAQKIFDKNPAETKLILKKIESQAKNISENIGDIVWSLKSSKDEFMSLSTRIKKITSEILGSSDIHYEILIDQSIDAQITDFSARKNIILICKEALNNILKHSQAQEVCLILQKTEDHYFLEIEDDGIGFSDLDRKGNGVMNMKRRAEELGGNLKITHNTGSKLVFIFPIIR
ncbi:sensor histidine kinase [Kaistella antarctica]|uniref:histidine kinase n=1 Tax=Kaistella antarctica TaxID=266748 RepID=A0A448NND5_9FLAO|nr:histidine kinase [Kaistella antarctica]KEY19788.1 hypothetical protein HY04_00735 [Kaistella antarctica]SEV97692.1 Histidine kinase [Kaistella antarctica]VEH96470.1 Sensor histidine kinase desK [Kaistella antarctica]